MRGIWSYCESLLSKIQVEDFVLANHPLRPIHTASNEALAKLAEVRRALSPAARSIDPGEAVQADFDAGRMFAYPTGWPYGMTADASKMSHGNIDCFGGKQSFSGWTWLPATSLLLPSTRQP